METLKVGVCCTFGAGSSLMLKMNLDSSFKRLGIDADVVVYDISGIKGVDLDAIFTSSALAPQVESSAEGTRTIVVPVVNYFDFPGLEDLIQKYLMTE